MRRLFDDCLGWMLQFLKRYTWAIIGVLVIEFGKNYAFTLLPKVSTNFLFELFTPERFQQIFKYFFLALIIIVIKGAFGYITTYSLSVISESAINRLRKSFFGHLIHLPLHFFKNSATGNIITMTIDDMSKIRTDLFEEIVALTSQFMLVALIITKLFVLNYLLTLLSFAIIPVLYLVLTTLGNAMRSTSKKLQQNVATLSTNLHESLTAVDVVKAFAKEDHEIGKFDRTSDGYKETSLKLKVQRSFFKPLNELIVYFFGFVLIGIGGVFILRGSWTVKELSEYLLLLAMLFPPMNNIPRGFTSLKVVRASMDRVYGVIKNENRIKEIPNPVSKKLEGDIRFRDVRFAYDGAPVLKGINIGVKKGDILALVGPSGAGKTTIINLIPRLYDTGGGKVEIDGIDVRNYGVKSLRSQIGIVSQNVILFNDTVYNNILYAKLDATREEVVEAAKKAHAYDFIRKLPKGFDTMVGEKGTRLSGGEKQRISIARTVLTNPQILILDEATSSLDSESEYHIQVALNELMEGKTSIVIAHRLSTITHANKVIVIDKGRVVARGTHKELLKKNPLYKRLYELQYFRA